MVLVGCSSLLSINRLFPVGISLILHVFCRWLRRSTPQGSAERQLFEQAEVQEFVVWLEESSSEDEDDDDDDGDGEDDEATEEEDG